MCVGGRNITKVLPENFPTVVNKPSKTKANVTMEYAPFKNPVNLNYLAPEDEANIHSSCSRWVLEQDRRHPRRGWWVFRWRRGGKKAPPKSASPEILSLWKSCEKSNQRDFFLMFSFFSYYILYFLNMDFAIAHLDCTLPVYLYMLIKMNSFSLNCCS